MIHLDHFIQILEKAFPVIKEIKEWVDVAVSLIKASLFVYGLLFKKNLMVTSLAVGV